MKILLLFLFCLPLLSGQIEVTWPNTTKTYIIDYGTKQVSFSRIINTNSFIFNPLPNRNYFVLVKEYKNGKIGPESEKVWVFVPEKKQIITNSAPNSYLKENVWLKKFKDSDFEQSKLAHEFIQEKWADLTSTGWYGIEMTNRMPVIFYKSIDEFFDWALENNPDMKILQVAQKFSWIKIYLDDVDEQTHIYCRELSSLLTDKNIQW